MNKKFNTLPEYLNIAKKIINTKATHFAKQMLRNDDIISNVATAIMLADWSWDIKRGCSKEGYRSKRAQWVIYQYIKHTKQNTMINLDIDRLNQIPDYTSNKIIHNDLFNYLTSIINDAINENIITEDSATFIKLYYLEGWTLRRIAKEYDFSHENIRKNIKKSIKQIRKIIQLK